MMQSNGAVLVARAGAAVAALVGIWLIVSPWIWLGHYANSAKWNDFFIGILVMYMMPMKVIFPSLRWISWAGIVIGLWILFSPWALEYSVNSGALRNNVIAAMMLIMVCSLAALATLAIQPRSVS